MGGRFSSERSTERFDDVSRRIESRNNSYFHESDQESHYTSLAPETSCKQSLTPNRSVHKYGSRYCLSPGRKMTSNGSSTRSFYQVFNEGSTTIDSDDKLSCQSQKRAKEPVVDQYKNKRIKLDDKFGESKIEWTENVDKPCTSKSLLTKRPLTSIVSRLENGDSDVTKHQASMFSNRSDTDTRDSDPRQSTLTPVSLFSVHRRQKLASLSNHDESSTFLSRDLASSSLSVLSSETRRLLRELDRRNSPVAATQKMRYNTLSDPISISQSVASNASAFQASSPEIGFRVEPTLSSKPPVSSLTTPYRAHVLPRLATLNKAPYARPAPKQTVDVGVSADLIIKTEPLMSTNVPQLASHKTTSKIKTVGGGRNKFSAVDLEHDEVEMSSYRVPSIDFNLTPHLPSKAPPVGFLDSVIESCQKSAMKPLGSPDVIVETFKFSSPIPVAPAPMGNADSPSQPTTIDVTLKSAAHKSPTTPSIQLFSKTPNLTSETTEKTWCCPTCYVKNKDEMMKCQACHEGKPGGEKKSISDGPVRSAQWYCPQCFISNDNDAHSCVACGAFRDGKRKKNETSVLKPTLGKWSCTTCFISNPADKFKCAACSTMKPGSEIQSISFGFKPKSTVTSTTAEVQTVAVEPASSKPSLLFDVPVASKQQINDGALFGFGAKAATPIVAVTSSSTLLPNSADTLSKWTCTTCFISNPSDKSKCAACSSAKPGSQGQLSSSTTTVTTTSSTNFSFGLTSSTTTAEKAVAVSTMPSSLFSFGKTIAGAAGQPQPTTSTTISFGVTPKPAATSAIFEAKTLPVNESTSKADVSVNDPPKSQLNGSSLFGLGTKTVTTPVGIASTLGSLPFVTVTTASVSNPSDTVSASASGALSFSLATSQTPSVMEKPAFSTATSTTTSSIFSFGQTSSSSQPQTMTTAVASTPFSLGLASSNFARSLNNAASAQTSDTQPSPFSFSASSDKLKAPSFGTGFNFGSSGGSAFGSTNKPVSSSSLTTGFSFNPPGSTLPLFGATTQKEGSSSTAVSTSGFNFGANLSTTFGPSSFSFGSTGSMSSAPVVGQQAATQQTNIFSVSKTSSSTGRKIAVAKRRIRP